MSHISVRHVTKIFGSQAAKMLGNVHNGVDKNTLLSKYRHGLGVYDINIDIEKGETFVIMGLSGSGKSTLIRHFNRLIEPTEGEIIVDGVDVMTLSKSELRDFRCNNMSMVFQHFGLMPHRRVIDNIAYGLKIQGKRPAFIRKEAYKWLEIAGLAGYEKAYPRSLSGGQQQRVGLARALAANTDILLMDEAFSALDPLIRSQMQDHLISIQAELNKTIVFITHDLSEALRLGSRIAILNDGKLAQVGTPQDVLLNPADDYVRAFVQDVNRSSVITVETVMRAPKLILSAQTSPEEALVQMEQGNVNRGWLPTTEGVALIKKEQLQQKSGARTLSELASPLKTVQMETTIDQIIPLAIGQTPPIPVLDENNRLQGVVDTECIADLLTEQLSTH
ncbi:MAG: glycine betaine/L-proline ABC transporter ATP-binding protein [Gammaproteobacteria bacterium]|nr:MAG: glycine betaine/L-proline ABC transporter ATP-binding protein [Gammaproteobacteria bacterium]